MAAEARWEQVLSSIDGLLIETESQDNNPVLGFHEASPLLNRLEMAVSVLRSLFDTDLDLDRNINQVLGQMCSLLTDIYQYWNVILDYGRRRILQTRGDPPFVIEKELLEDLRSASYTWMDNCQDVTNFALDLA